MQEITKEKVMTNDKLKEMVLELSKHLASANEIISKINANHDLEFVVNDNWDTPSVLRATITTNIDTGKLEAELQSADLIDNLGFDFEWTDRDGEVYPFQKETVVAGVKIFELFNKK